MCACTHIYSLSSCLIAVSDKVGSLMAIRWQWGLWGSAASFTWSAELWLFVVRAEEAACQARGSMFGVVGVKAKAGAGATALCDPGARLAALCTSKTLPETHGGLCFLTECADMFACCGILSLRLDARHASPDVSRVSKLFKEFGRRERKKKKEKQLRNGSLKIWASESGPQAGRRQASVSRLMQSDVLFLRSPVGECSAVTVPHRGPASPPLHASPTDMKNLLSVRSDLWLEPDESWVKVAVGKVTRGQTLIYASDQWPVRRRRTFLERPGWCCHHHTSRSDHFCRFGEFCCDLICK